MRSPAVPVRLLLSLLLPWLVMVSLSAQGDPERSTSGTIEYDMPVEDGITDDAPFDRWQLNAAQGDVVVIEMAASGGLAPLVAVLDNGNNLLFLSDTLPDGTMVPPEVDGTATLEFEAPYTGPYFIVATREGRDEGSTTGSYTLLVRRASGATSADREARQEVIFRCGAVEAATVTTLLFAGEGSGGYRVSVYGLDGFEPVVRLSVQTTETAEACSEPDEAVIGDQVAIPGGVSLTVTDAVQVARTGIRSENLNVSFAITIGSRDGAPGRYVALIEGFSIDPANDDDDYTVRFGPLATETVLDVYMIGPGRLDPYIVRQPYLADPEGDPAFCDDAGRRGCEEMPGAADFLLDFADESQQDVRGDRFDAGVRLAPGTQDAVDLVFSSREGITRGAYAMLLIGELPPRESDGE